jgi:hypothetical protein
MRQQLTKDYTRRTEMTRNDTETRASATVNDRAPTESWREFVPTDEQIRSRAHEIYQARCDNGDNGDELADWIAAECELKARGNDNQQVTPNEAASGEAGRRWRPADHPVGSSDLL